MRKCAFFCLLVCASLHAYGATPSPPRPAPATAPVDWNGRSVEALRALKQPAPPLSPLGELYPLMLE